MYDDDCTAYYDVQLYTLMKGLELLAGWLVRVGSVQSE